MFNCGIGLKASSFLRQTKAASVCSKSPRLVSLDQKTDLSLALMYCSFSWMTTLKPTWMKRPHNSVPRNIKSIKRPVQQQPSWFVGVVMAPLLVCKIKPALNSTLLILKALDVIKSIETYTWPQCQQANEESLAYFANLDYKTWLFRCVHVKHMEMLTWPGIFRNLDKVLGIIWDELVISVSKFILGSSVFDPTKK